MPLKENRANIKEMESNSVVIQWGVYGLLFFLLAVIVLLFIQLIKGEVRSITEYVNSNSDMFIVGVLLIAFWLYVIYLEFGRG